MKTIDETVLRSQLDYITKQRKELEENFEQISNLTLWMQASITTFIGLSAGAVSLTSGVSVPASAIVTLGTLGAGIVGSNFLTKWYKERRLKNIQSKEANTKYELLSGMKELKLVSFKNNEYTRARKSELGNSVIIENIHGKNAMRLEFEGNDIDCIYDPKSEQYTVVLHKGLETVSLDCVQDNVWKRLETLQLGLDESSERKFNELINRVKRFDYMETLCEYEQREKRKMNAAEFSFGVDEYNTLYKDNDKITVQKVHDNHKTELHFSGKPRLQETEDGIRIVLPVKNGQVKMTFEGEGSNRTEFVKLSDTNAVRRLNNIVSIFRSTEGSTVNLIPDEKPKIMVRKK